MQQNEFSILRAQSGLSLDELSARLGYSSRQLYRWERGEGEPREAAIQMLRTLGGAGAPSPTSGRCRPSRW